ncbi:MAG: hypothetical protein Tsb0032_09530 [Kiloniellaceae bacterium]
MPRSSLSFIATGLSLVLLAPMVLAPGAAFAQAAVLNRLQNIIDRLDAQVVPFKLEEINGGLCDSAGANTSNPVITIDSDGAEGEFVITSIILKSASPGAPLTGLRDVSINHVQIDGERYDTVTGNLLGPTDGTGVLESTDLMGTPTRRSGDREAPVAGGNFPHQIVAQSEGIDDVSIELFCSSVDDDFTFDRILVAGWKRPADTVTVIFTPGN